jgi:hypothetical protein
MINLDTAVHEETRLHSSGLIDLESDDWQFEHPHRQSQGLRDDTIDLTVSGGRYDSHGGVPIAVLLEQLEESNADRDFFRAEAERFRFAVAELEKKCESLKKPPCTICLEAEPGYVLTCGHCYCWSCISSVSGGNLAVICPTCRNTGTIIKQIYY